MEFGFNVTALLNADSNGIAILSGKDLQSFSKKSIESAFMVIDEMGKASAKAQGLKSIITTGGKFTGSDHIIYMMCEGKKAIGFLKIGKKNLFIRNELGSIKEIKPMCLLDFYVHESQQRNGHGKTLFDKMLKTEFLEARKLAYDRPSNKLLKFLEKNFKLVDYIPQNNNFVVYNDYFENFNFKTSGLEDRENFYPTKRLSRDTSYGEFKNSQSNSLNKLNSNQNVGKIVARNSSKEVNSTSRTNQPPWATGGQSDHFVSSSSSYGAYFAYENKANNKFY